MSYRDGKKDGYRKFGDHVMMFNGKAEAFLGKKFGICSYGCFLEVVEYGGIV